MSSECVTMAHLPSYPKCLVLNVSQNKRTSEAVQAAMPLGPNDPIDPMVSVADKDAVWNLW